MGRIDRAISCSRQTNTRSLPNKCTNRGSAVKPGGYIYILVVVGVCGFVGGGLVCLVGVFWWGVGGLGEGRW